MATYGVVQPIARQLGLTQLGTLRARLGAAAAEHAHRSFDPVRNARAVEDVYDTLLGIETERAVTAELALA